MKITVIFLFTLGLLSSPLFGQVKHPAHRAEAAKFYRTELFFGRSRPDGGQVSAEEWAAFLKEVVTPRFPDGFTVLEASGQYRDESGRIVSEPCGVLVILYPAASKRQSRARIEEIRDAYVRMFHQESVLRADGKDRIGVYFEE